MTFQNASNSSPPRRTRAHSLRLALACVGAIALAGCSSEEVGTARFTTWGEEYIEEGIPADPDGGFVDGWEVTYDKFLVAFHEIEVADADGEIAATSADSYFVDNVVPGKKDLVSFSDLPAKAWDRVSYQIKPPTADTKVVAGDSVDLELMLEQGYSVYIEGSATKQDVTKTFKLGFDQATQYRECKAEQNGKTTLGIVVANGSEDVSELTTHGDHFFYDRLQGSSDSAVETSLRFDAIAAADDAGDADDAITFEELEEAPLDVELYDPSGLSASNMKDFMSALVRTVGHFRGEGECKVSNVAD